MNKLARKPLSLRMMMSLTCRICMSCVLTGWGMWVQYSDKYHRSSPRPRIGPSGRPFWINEFYGQWTYG